MNAQPTSLFPGARMLEGSASDFQQMVSRVVAIVRQRRWLFILPLLAGVLAGLVGSLFLPRRYVLGSLFERRDDVVITNLLTSNSPYSFETLRRSLPIDLIGYNALSDAIDQLGLTRDLPRDAAGQLTAEGKERRQGMMNRLSKQLDVNLAEKSTFLDLIEVGYAGDQPDLGMQLVTRLKDNYIIRTRQRISDILVKSHSFFKQESQKRQQKAATMEAELLQMTVQHPGVDPSDPGVLDQRLLNHNIALEEIARRKGENLTKLQGCEEYLAQLEGRPVSVGPSSQSVMSGVMTVQNPQRQRIMQTIEKVRGEITDAITLRSMTDEHPLVVGLRQKIQELEKQMAGMPETVAAGAPAGPSEPGLTALEAEKRRLTMDIKSLKGLLAQIDDEEQRHNRDRKRLEEEKGGLFERRQTFLRQQQELQTAKSDLNVWENHVETIARVLTAESEARGIQFTTVDEARRPSKPVSPTVPGVFLVSIAIGIALGTAAVFLREVLDRSIRNVQRVRESLNIPVLETIGEIRLRRGAGRFLRRLACPTVAAAEVMALGVVGVLAYLSVEQPMLYQQLAAPLRRILPI